MAAQSAPDSRTLSEVVWQVYPGAVAVYLRQESQASSSVVACFLEAVEIAADMALAS